MKLASITILLLACATVNAQVYSYVDKNGNTIYTDSPPEHQETRKLDIPLTQAPKPEPTEQQAQTTSDEDTKTVRLSPNNSSPVNDDEALRTATTSINSPTKATAVMNYQRIDILQPTKDETIRNSAGELTIAVKSDPALAQNHLYQFLIDGNAVAKTTAATYKMSGLTRGEHKLIVEIINADNEQTILRSQEQSFFIKQTSLAEKRRIRPCLIREYGVRPECPLKDKPKPQPRNLLLRVTDLTGITSPASAAK